MCLFNETFRRMKIESKPLLPITWDVVMER